MMMFTGTETLANPMRFICTETLVTPPLQDNQKLSDEIRRLLDKVEALEAEKLVAHPQTLTHERQLLEDERERNAASLDDAHNKCTQLQGEVDSY
jgi:hypothetical protein